MPGVFRLTRPRGASESEMKRGASIRRKALVLLSRTIERIGEPFASLLLSMYFGEPQAGSDGKMYQIDAATRISPQQGMWIYDLCLACKPKFTLEIGFAYGFSTLYFLAAIKANGSGTHVAIDPFEMTAWNGIGLQLARTCGMASSFRFLDERSSLALSRFRHEQAKFEVIFIDGNHRFDDVLVDFTLAAEICGHGGIIILDDMWMASIRKVVAFIRSNREDFTQVPTTVENIAVFRKISNKLREWNHFVDFK